MNCEDSWIVEVAYIERFLHFMKLNLRLTEQYGRFFEAKLFVPVGEGTIGINNDDSLILNWSVHVQRRVCILSYHRRANVLACIKYTTLRRFSSRWVDPSQRLATTVVSGGHLHFYH